MIMFCASQLVAQNDDCDVTINRALDEFNSGHFYTIPSVLSPCLDQFTREQSQRAYLLLTQTYLLLDDPISAKQSYLSLLKANPEFQTDTALHAIDVIYLSKRFTSTPVFSWMVKMGSNISMPRVIYDRDAFGESGVKEKYGLKMGYQAGIGGDYNFTDKVQLRMEAVYALATYTHRSTNYFEQDSKQMTDRQNWLTIPLTVIYGDNKGKYRPYAYLGYSFQYLFRDKVNITLSNNRPVLTSGELLQPGDIGRREDTQEESPTFDFLHKRNRVNQAILAGGGTKIKIGLDFIFVDVRYSLGLKNIISAKGAYSDNTADPISNGFVASQEVPTRFAHVDDLFRLDNLLVSFGFLRPLYKPRELKRAQTRSVMKQMKR
jgi:outer membrane protein W